MGTSNKQLGDRGEALVQAWLQQRGWMIVAQQWHCRWGELDIVARHPSTGLVFVEVKTRQRHSLDWGGRLAITPQKQQKLWRSAQQFLLEHDDLTELPSRFDVALVAPKQAAQSLPKPPLELLAYLEDAFQLEG